ncbi:hypothetical protein [Vagococcus xieshaowenii]|uniref:Uncharacterized protein n=1 Tax=Vagococcus xieshaowenii TaxID=2562451 RepID=A0AAJ5JLZ7_9ENTE|nr:hypothetical protein [Vagococcus xieshaowenii]QCA29452.1 hypothetical protein E4Z98_09030 [Vagococcus xieshaowenii]TFZ39621.1 hypothetical protein E4031_08710 [Vagococcus xieshaowenii]
MIRLMLVLGLIALIGFFIIPRIGIQWQLDRARGVRPKTEAFTQKLARLQVIENHRHLHHVLYSMGLLVLVVVILFSQILLLQRERGLLSKEVTELSESLMEVTRQQEQAAYRFSLATYPKEGIGVQDYVLHPSDDLVATTKQARRLADVLAPYFSYTPPNLLIGKESWVFSGQQVVMDDRQLALRRENQAAFIEEVSQLTEIQSVIFEWQGVQSIEREIYQRNHSEDSLRLVERTEN